MNLNAAAIFVRVVEARGFSAAARTLGMPKTTVSKKVGELEGELGVRLLNRTTRALSLTEAGARVHAHCVTALAHMDAAEREARALQREPDGPLTIAAPGAIAVTALLPAITAFIDRYPGVHVTLLSTNDLTELESGRADVMIWAALAMPPGHAVRLVARIEIGLFASVAYLARMGMPETPAALAGHAVVAATQSAPDRRFRWRLARGEVAVDITPTAQPRFWSNDPIAVLEVIAAGHGIGGLPLRFVEQIPHGHALRAVLPEWRIAPIELSALFRDGSASSLKTRLFLDFVAAWFRDM